MEAPTEHRISAEPVHLSGPLAVVYAEIRERIMCYAKTEAMLLEVENELLDILRKGYMHDRAESTFDEIETLVDLEARQHLHDLLCETNGCCADSIVAMQDEIERLRFWSENG